MMWFGRKLIALLTSAVVFAVGATCTPGGCLLPGQVARAESTHSPSCCAGGAGKHAGSSDKSPAHHGPKSCPVCNQPLAITAKFDAGLGGVGMMALLSLTPVELFEGAIEPSRVATEALDRPPPRGSPTLFDLHCALLV